MSFQYVDPDRQRRRSFKVDSSVFGEYEQRAAHYYYTVRGCQRRPDMRVVTSVYFPQQKSSYVMLPLHYFAAKQDHAFWCVVAFYGGLDRPQIKGYLATADLQLADAPRHQFVSHVTVEQAAKEQGPIIAEKGSRLGPMAADVAWDDVVILPQSYFIPKPALYKSLRPSTAEATRVRSGSRGNLGLNNNKHSSSSGVLQPPAMPAPASVRRSRRSESWDFNTRGVNSLLETQPDSARLQTPHEPNSGYSTPTPSSGKPRRPKRAWRVGDRLDVKDGDGRWNAATILDLDEKSFLIHYDGYDPSFDEWVDISRKRMARLHKHTKKQKRTKVPTLEEQQMAFVLLTQIKNQIQDPAIRAAIEQHEQAVRSGVHTLELPTSSSAPSNSGSGSVTPLSYPGSASPPSGGQQHVRSRRGARPPGLHLDPASNRKGVPGPSKSDYETKHDSVSEDDDDDEEEEEQVAGDHNRPPLFRHGGRSRSAAHYADPDYKPDLAASAAAAVAAHDRAARMGTFTQTTSIPPLANPPPPSPHRPLSSQGRHRVERISEDSERTNTSMGVIVTSAEHAEETAETLDLDGTSVSAVATDSAQLQELNAQLQTKDQRIEELERQLQEAELASERHRALYTEAMKSHEQVKEAHLNAQMAAKEHKSEVEQEREQRQALVERQAALSQSLHDLSILYQKAQDESRAKEQKLYKEALQKQEKWLTAVTEKNALAQSAKELESERQRHEAQTRMLKQELRRVHEEAEEEKKELQRALDKLKTEKKQMATTLKSAELQLLEFGVRIGDLDVSDDAQQSIQQRIEAQHEEEVAKLKAELARKYAANDSEQIAELRAAKEEAERQVTALRKEHQRVAVPLMVKNDENSVRLELQLDEIGMLRDTLDEVTRQKQELEAALKEQPDAYRAHLRMEDNMLLRRELQREKVRSAELQHQVMDTEEQVARLKQTLTMMYGGGDPGAMNGPGAQRTPVRLPVVNGSAPGVHTTWRSSEDEDAQSESSSVATAYGRNASLSSPGQRLVPRMSADLLAMTTEDDDLNNTTSTARTATTTGSPGRKRRGSGSKRGRRKTSKTGKTKGKKGSQGGGGTPVFPWWMDTQGPGRPRKGAKTDRRTRPRPRLAKSVSVNTGMKQLYIPSPPSKPKRPGANGRARPRRQMT